MEVMQIVASNIFRCFVINGRRYFLSDQFHQWCLAGVVTHQLNSIPKDGKIASIAIAQVSSVNFEGRKWIGARQLHMSARERGHVCYGEQKIPMIRRTCELSSNRK